METSLGKYLIIAAIEVQIPYLITGCQYGSLYSLVTLRETHFVVLIVYEYCVHCVLVFWIVYVVQKMHHFQKICITTGHLANHIEQHLQFKSKYES